MADRPLRDEADCLSVIPVTHVVYWGMDPFSAELRQMLQMHIQILSADDIASFVRFQFSVAAGDSDSDSRPASDTSADQLNSSALSCALAIGDGAGADPVVGDRCPAICASQQQDYDMDAEHSEDSLDDDADDKDENWSTCSETECDNRPDDDEAESDKARTTSSSSNGIAASQSTDSDADSSLGRNRILRLSECHFHRCPSPAAPAHQTGGRSDKYIGFCYFKRSVCFKRRHCW